MTSGTLKNVSVLCVDNYIDTLELLKLHLQIEGARVFTATSAEEAVRAFIKYHPDILISDLALPQRDGITLLKAIRDAGGEIPAIALTGISDAEVREQALRAGFDHYFVKPVDDRLLIQAVSSLATKVGKTGSLAAPLSLNG